MKKYFFAFFVFTSCLFASERKDLLFVGFDAGEMNIWVQILKDWQEVPEVDILTMATATKVVREAGFNQAISVESLGITCPSSQRLYELNSGDLEKINLLNASVLVTGMYSTPERQIAELFAKKKCTIVAVWDNFSTFEKLPLDLVANVEKIIKVATTILVPSDEVAQDLNSRFHCDKAIPLGQPTLDLWEEKIAQIDRLAAFEKTSLDPKLPIITYISGYEEKGNRYCDSFDLFARSLESLEKPAQVIVQLHPRSDGSYEKKVLEQLTIEYPQFPKFFISSGKDLSTFEAVALADLVICHRSTVAVQALFAGKHCLHIDVPDTPFSHFAIAAGLVPQCLTQQDAAEAINSYLQKPLDIDGLYEKSGIHPHPTESYRNYLKSIVK